MRYATLTVFFFGLLVVSCVNTEATKLSAAPEGLEPVDTSEVVVYADSMGVECPSERVAMIRTEGTTSGVSDKKMIENTKEKAAELGANAVIVGGLDTDDPDYNPMLLGGSDYGSRQGRFLAVREQRPCE